MSEKRFRFRLLRGGHTEGGKLYNKGDIVDSRSDLRRLNSSMPGGEKFQFIGEVNIDEKLPEPAIEEIPNYPVPPASDTLESMNVNELKKLAADEEIDVTGCTTKASLIKAIRDAG